MLPFGKAGGSIRFGLPACRFTSPRMVYQPKDDRQAFFGSLPDRSGGISF